MRVKGEGHPNGVLHSKWARCIVENLTDSALVGERSAPQDAIDRE
jgi:hypothetical protein